MAAGKLQGTPGTKFSTQVTDKTNGNQRICFCRLGESGKPCSLRVEEDCEAFLAEDGRVVILGQATEVCRS